jgi:Transposase and inactivated derivatives
MGYPTDLSDEQWAIVSPLIPPAKPGGRPRTGLVAQIRPGPPCWPESLTRKELSDFSPL